MVLYRWAKHLASTKDLGSSPGSGAKIKGELKMKIMKMSLLMVLMFTMITAATSGCAILNRDASPREKYVVAQESFMLVVGSVLDAKRGGLIEQDKYNIVVLPLITEGSRLLDSMEIMFKQNRFDEVELLRQALISIVIKLQMEIP